jgi:hypothetical protein
MSNLTNAATPLLAHKPSVSDSKHRLISTSDNPLNVPVHAASTLVAHKQQPVSTSSSVTLPLSDERKHYSTTQSSDLGAPVSFTVPGTPTTQTTQTTTSTIPPSSATGVEKGDRDRHTAHQSIAMFVMQPRFKHARKGITAVIVAYIVVLCILLLTKAALRTYAILVRIFLIRVCFRSFFFPRFFFSIFRFFDFSFFSFVKSLEKENSFHRACGRPPTPLC